MKSKTQLDNWDVEFEDLGPNAYFIYAKVGSVIKNNSEISIFCNHENFKIVFAYSIFHRTYASIVKEISNYEIYKIKYSFDQKKFYYFHLEDEGDNVILTLSRIHEIKNFFKQAKGKSILYMYLPDNNGEIKFHEQNIAGISKVYEFILEYSQNINTLITYGNWNLSKINYDGTNSISCQITYAHNSTDNNVDVSLVYEIDSNGEESLLIIFNDFTSLNNINFNYRNFVYKLSFDNKTERIEFKVDCFNNKLYFFSNENNINILKHLFLNSSMMQILLKDKDDNKLIFSFDLYGFDDAIEDIHFEKEL